MKTQTLICFLVLVTISQTAELPDFIKLCRRNDPELSKCAVANAKEALPFLVEGIRSLNIPSLKPLKLPFIHMEAAGNFQLNFTDLEVHGLDKAEPVDIQFDFNKRQVKTVIDIDEALIKGNYIVDGKVLILPINGEGTSSIKILGGRYTFIFSYKVVEKDGDQYMKLVDNELTFTLKKAEFDFQNLFNGDKKLGAEMNKFLNENWKDIASEFGTVIGQTVATICGSISKNILEDIPFKKLFIQS